MNLFRRSFYYIFLSVDFISIVISFFYADILSQSRLPLRVTSGLKGITADEIFTLFFFLLIWFFYSRSSSLYDEFKISNLGSQIFILLKNLVSQLVFAIVILFFLKSIILSRFFLVIYLVSLTILTLFSRTCFRVVRYHLLKQGFLKKRVVLVGSGESGEKYISSLNKVAKGEYNVVGIFSDSSSATVSENYLGGLNRLGSVIENIDVDEVVVALSEKENNKMKEILRELSDFPVKVRIIPEYFRFVSHKYQISFFEDFPVIDVINDPLDELHWRIVKRTFDFVFSLFAIVFFLSWTFPFIALAIKLDSKGPVLFKQERWGKKNRRFTLYKFRSMRTGSSDLDKKGKFVQAKKDDERVTKVGRILRKTSLDELPQFFNVLKGDMSVVGPRPHAVPQNIESKGRIENYMLRHLVKPGITGWAQVNGFRGETKTDAQMKKRVELDMIYIENWTFWLDIKIIFMTLWKGIKGDPVAY